MELAVESPAIVCRACSGLKTDVIAEKGRQVLRCRRCRRTWQPYDTSPSPAPDYRTVYRIAPAEHEEGETLTVLQAGLDAVAAATAAGQRRPDPTARRLLLLRGFDVDTEGVYAAGPLRA
ncbi:hypothetical protein ACFWGM_36210, partial [Streptomyces roseolus]